MTFISIKFLVFMCILLALLWAVKLIFKGRYPIITRLILLVASYAFLYMADWRFLLIMVSVSLITYAAGMSISGKHKKLYAAIGIVAPLIALAAFKYLDFFIGSVSALFNIERAGALNIMLPLGISFYTFSAISYIVDVYREKLPPERDFTRVGLYLAFFPKIIAGPIMQADDFITQTRKEPVVSVDNLSAGLQIFLVGMFKKAVLADRLAVFVDQVFAAPNVFGGFTVFWAVVSYVLQLYLDFSGYTDMATGLSRLMGFKLVKNFDLPYIARSIPEYWRRWHISLHLWFRDYLFYPIMRLGWLRKLAKRLGKSGRRLLPTGVALLIVWFSMGLWHGASWNYVLFGLYHGTLIFLGFALKPAFDKLKAALRIREDCVVFNAFRLVRTLVLIAFGDILFRAEDLSAVSGILGGMFTPGGVTHVYTWTAVALTLTIIATLIARIKSGKGEITGFYPELDLNKFWALVIFLTALGLTIGLAYFGDNPFIYAQF